MRLPTSKLLTKIAGCLALAGFVSLPAWGQNSGARTLSNSPQSVAPGTINYVEGQAKIGSETLSSQSVGKVELKADQTLDTQNGRVEILLTPGVFLRVGSDSSVTMLSPSLTNTKIKIDRGEATVEVDDYHSQNNLMVAEDDATAYLVHTGFYSFVPEQGLVRVVKGQVVVLRNDRHIRVNPGHQVELFPESAQLKATRFNVNEYKKGDPLYSWSKLRSQYLAEANVNAAPRVYGWNGWGPGWYGPGWWGPGPGWGWYGRGWYWNPWFMSYTYIPGSGIIYSPFGWGFYSPLTVRSAPYVIEGRRVRHFDRGSDSWRLRGERRGFEHKPHRTAPGWTQGRVEHGEHLGRHGGRR